MRYRRSAAALSILIPLLAGTMAAHAGTPAASSGADAPCSDIPHMDHPHVMLTSGDLHVLVFLPDAKDGYYRAERFDWSGVIGCASYQGHTFWGEWFRRYDPLINDSITGPVEEFRPADGAQGYAAAQPGSPFVKIGVGVLRKVADVPYRFSDTFPIVDNGHWEVHTGKHSITFRQRLVSPTGVSYLYTKKLLLDRNGLRLEHTLQDLGNQPIVTDVYDHDFYMLDGKPTGPGFVLHLPFAPSAQTALQPDATIQGHDIVYLKELAPGQTVASYLGGYEGEPGGYSLRLENTETHVSVEQTADVPMSRFYLWSIRSTICPEAYIHLDVPPHRSRKWTISYRFFSGSQS